MNIREKFLEWLFGAAGGAAILVKLIIELIKLRQKSMIAIFTRKHKQVTASIERIYEVMQKVTQLDAVDAILIMKFHNGGKLPAVDKSVFLTAMYEDADESQFASKYLYQHIETDGGYMRTLHQLISEKEVNTSVDQLPKGIMKSNWQSSGVQSGRLFWLHTNKERTMYVVIKSKMDLKSLLGNKEDQIIRFAIQELKQIFKT